MSTEADTCRRFVLPKLYAAGWDDDRIGEQWTFTDRRMVAVGTRPRQHQTQTAAELDALLPSILDKAFKGEL